MTTTVSIQVGNTDDKLPQLEWAKLLRRVHRAIVSDVLIRGGTLHFEGFARADVAYQNACWIVELPSSEDEAGRAERTLRRDLAWLAEVFMQDAVAWTAGTTDFIAPIGSSGLHGLAVAAKPPAVTDESGLNFSREPDDAPLPPSTARVPMHTGGIVSDGVLVDETVTTTD